MLAVIGLITIDERQESRFAPMQIRWCLLEPTDRSMAVSLQQFREQVATLGLASAAELDKFCVKLADLDGEKQAEQLARALVHKKKLTAFQAQQIYAGKGKALLLGNYLVLDKLGQGGMGTVYKAQHKTLSSRVVALKTLSPELAKKPNFVERFLREAQSMDKLKHPNVVDVMDVDEANGVYFIALEFIDGKSMEDWIGELNEPLSLGDALKIVLDCANALKHAHEVNIIHRDIKPDNILITKDGIVKVADFGLAKATDEEDQSVTQTGAGLGTPLYMAPEQARNAKYVDHRTDIYALGCTFYYMLMGKHAFKGDSVVEIITKKEKGEYKPVRGHRAEVDLVIGKMIDAKPDRRHKDYDVLIKELVAACGQPNEALSFIDGAVPSQQSAVSTSAPTSAQMAQTKAAAGSSTADQKKTKTSTSKSQARTKASTSSTGATKQKAWLVRFKTKQGKETVQKFSTEKIRKGIAAGLIGVDATGTTSKKQPFKPLREFPEFAGMMKTQQVKKKDESKRKKMQDVIAAADKDIQRRKRWKWLRNLKESTFGYVGFILYLAAIGAVFYGLYLGLPILWKWLAPMVGMGS